MGRWQPDSRGRLQESALALFAERGFDQITAAEIAERVGVTERTFFRHFADKREVLFGGSDYLKELILEGVVAAPASDGPLDAVVRGLQVAAVLLGEGRRDLARQRQAVIRANPELHERELSKLADYASSVAGALRQRGATDVQADFAAEIGMTVFRLAMAQWVESNEDTDLPSVMQRSLADLRALTVDT